MSRVAFVTHQASPDVTPDDLLAVELLRARGVDVVPAPWNDPGVDWRTFGCVIVRSCWDYHLHARAFTEWLDALKRDGCTVWNPVSLLRWNLRKTYLLELESCGVPTVSTVLVRRASANEWRSTFNQLGCDEVVVKPVIGATAHETWRCSIVDARALQPRFTEMVERDDVLVQPFLREIEREGEWSLTYIDGAYSHAVIKRAKAGDFRSQEEWGGAVIPAVPNASIRAAGRRAMDAVGEPTLYARVDLVVVNETPLMMELELIEPELYLRASPEGGRRLAEAILRRLRPT